MWQKHVCEALSTEPGTQSVPLTGTQLSRSTLRNRHALPQLCLPLLLETPAKLQPWWLPPYTVHLPTSGALPLPTWNSRLPPTLSPKLISGTSFTTPVCPSQSEEVWCSELGQHRIWAVLLAASCGTIAHALLRPMCTSSLSCWTLS